MASLVISVAEHLSSSNESVPFLKGISDNDREMRAGRHGEPEGVELGELRDSVSL